MKPDTAPLFVGCATALVTPMLPAPAGDGYTPPPVDYESFVRLVRRQIAAGVDALVVCGTTGESSTLTDEEKLRLFSLAVQESRRAEAEGIARRHIPVIAGTGSNNTVRAVTLSRLAEKAGCDGLLAVTPYYNKANQAGLVAHYAAITAAVPLPLLAYHVPGRTGCRLTPETCLTLSRMEQIVGLKDATGDAAFTARVAALCGDALPLYAGCDDCILPVLALGGRGAVSVASNLYPDTVTALCRAYRAGDTAQARRLQADLLPLCEALFADVNPIPVKAALAGLGLCRDVLRLPLTPAGEDVRHRVRDAMQKAGRPV